MDNGNNVTVFYDLINGLDDESIAVCDRLLLAAPAFLC